MEPDAEALAAQILEGADPVPPAAEAAAEPVPVPEAAVREEDDDLIFDLAELDPAPAEPEAPREGDSGPSPVGQVPEVVVREEDDDLIFDLSEPEAPGEGDIPSTVVSEDLSHPVPVPEVAAPEEDDHIFDLAEPEPTPAEPEASARATPDSVGQVFNLSGPVENLSHGEAPGTLADASGSAGVPAPAPEIPVTATADLADADRRRLDVDAKQELVARLLHDTGCEGLLVLHPANFRWLTAGATPAGLAGRDETPALFFNAHQRWLIASATDSPRLFADELDGLGFQLKEWPWAASREKLLGDLVYGRKVACDQPFRDCKLIGPFFAFRRRQTSPYEAERLAELGLLVSHALAATARTFTWGDTEEEIAGHLAHRLLRHGAEAVALQVNGDGRGRALRRRGFRSEPVERSCVLQVTARKFGLHATAARTVFRSTPDETERAEFETALRVRVAHLAVADAGRRVARTLDAGRAVLRPTPFEHEWRLAPSVCLTGREPSEGIFLEGAKDRWVAGWAVIWQERIGAAAVVDTYLVEATGWRPVTPPKEWPIRRAVSQGRSFDLADLLVRGD